LSLRTSITSDQIMMHQSQMLLAFFVFTNVTSGRLHVYDISKLDNELVAIPEADDKSSSSDSNRDSEEQTEPQDSTEFDVFQPTNAIVGDMDQTDLDFMNMLSSTDIIDFLVSDDSHDGDHDFDFKDNQGDHVRGDHQSGDQDGNQDVDTNRDHTFKDHPEEHDRGDEMTGTSNDGGDGSVSGSATVSVPVIQGNIVSADQVDKHSERGTVGHRGPKSRFQNKDNVQNEQSHAANKGNEEKARDSGSKWKGGFCAWDGKGCYNGCDETELRAFCATLNSMESCSDKQDNHGKCVWIQEVDESVFSMEMLTASRFGRKQSFGWVQLVVEVTCILLIGLAILEMCRWWRYRGYTKLADEHSEGDLMNTIV